MTTNASYITPWRLLTAARVFTLAVALGLATATREVSEAAPAFLALCVLAAAMSVPTSSATMQPLAPITEGALAALVLVSAGGTATPLLLYLVIPAFVAGMHVGGKWPLVVVTTEGAAAVAALLAGQRASDLSRMLENTAPWMLAGLGFGLFGSWVRSSIAERGGDQAGYESAHRLLGELREVSRRLSSGLDVNALADQTLTHTREALDGRRVLLLVRTDGSTLSPVAAVGAPFKGHLEHDPGVSECWMSEQPHRRRLDDAETTYRHRTIVPLRVGARMLGVIVIDGPTAVDRRALSRLRPYLDEASLRLETAFLFDDVRSTATLEERNRLAREIHDGVAQEIASLGYLVDDLTAGASTPETREAATSLRQELTRVVSELRLSIFDLRSTVNPHAGLGLALSDYAREVGKRGGLTVHLALSEQPQRLSTHVETEMLRIAQEAITNARKHARANNLWVTLNTESPVVTMRIEDDGVGSAEIREHHYGLRIMHERAQRIGGELTVAPRPRGGTTVMVTVWPHSVATPGDNHVDLSNSR